MKTQELITALGYADSPHFLDVSRFDEIPAHAHVFRRAHRRCSLQGVYLLRDETTNSSSATPVVYVAEAESREEANEIHRQVWNQNTVPFLIVRTPEGVRLYSGFAYRSPESPDQEPEGVLRTLLDFQHVTTELAAFHANQIDRGWLFREWGQEIRPEKRVDHRLLGNLEAIGQQLHEEDVPRETAHALIGKLVYLRYLRDRDILSDRRLAAWKIHPEAIFGRRIDVAEFERLNTCLDDWLNGEIFPVSLEASSQLSRGQIERTAGVFLGDDARTGQLHLDFQAYDFSHLPIETLSTIYEQFLAIEGKSSESGAFYTPVPLVNFMIAEIEDHQPLEVGMKVLDPACGSGAFLVQSYRHLIEKRMAQINRNLRPAELRELLVRQIFGVDRDGDACRVAELSLVLTMLDYIDPPDLQSTPNFKLPKLHDQNIFQCDFFDAYSSWATSKGREKYDWILGNPPWVVLKDSASNHAIHQWLKENKHCPINGRQSAEVFAWKVLDHIAPHPGIIGLLLPAMSLFKKEPKVGFRKSFFRKVETLAVANFTNLREVLFSGRARLPSAAFFYRNSDETEGHRDILVYSPFAINQETNRRGQKKRRQLVWSLVPNSSEITFLRHSELFDGSSTPWKLAMWGSGRDCCFIHKIRQRLGSFGEWAERQNIEISEGLQLCSPSSTEETKPAFDLIGKKKFSLKAVRNLQGIHFATNHFFETIVADSAFLRVRGGTKPLSICHPPHIILSAARNFSVYSDEFFVVPPRQIGISGSEEQRSILKALSLYLHSDFVKYFEFFYAPQAGVTRNLYGTVETLKKIPMPTGAYEKMTSEEWSRLHRDISGISRRYLNEYFDEEAPSSRVEKRMLEIKFLRGEINELTKKALNLTEKECWLIHDLVQIRMSLTDGKLGEPAVRRPSEEDLQGYGEMLASELDDFLPHDSKQSHQVKIWNGTQEGFISIELIPKERRDPRVLLHDEKDVVAQTMDRLQREHRNFTRQWIYFDRNLFVYDQERILIFKPQQRVWWTRSQAMSDADEIVASALTTGEVM